MLSIVYTFKMECDSLTIKVRGILISLELGDEELGLLPQQILPVHLLKEWMITYTTIT